MTRREKTAFYGKSSIFGKKGSFPPFLLSCHNEVIFKQTFHIFTLFGYREEKILVLLFHLITFKGTSLVILSQIWALAL